ncbi:recombination regulator RecX [Streptomyces sp. NPDC001928]|uniref:recombination regulator RecX n=1 Tax=Streptomyces sp. NPDC001928 TaxID=3154404 RepID=UPI0033189B6E
MTRRTDWGEYAAYPDAPQGRGRGGDEGSSGRGGHVSGGDAGHDADGGNDGSALYGTGGSGWYGTGDSHDARGSYGGYGGHGDSGSGYGDESGPVHDAGASGGGSRRGRGGTGGSDGSRGRRRRGRTEPSGEDGGASSSSRAEERTPPADPVEQARAICLRLLTGTPRTRKQLADALRKREIPDEAAEEVLSRFEEVGLINDSAFADAWVESRHHGRGLARRALAQELRTKGVDSTLIDAAVGQLDSEQEEATARELVARKLRSTRGLDRDKRLRRLAGMLARKGYPEGMALRVVRQALEEEGEDTEFLGDEGF